MTTERDYKVDLDSGDTVKVRLKKNEGTGDFDCVTISDEAGNPVDLSEDDTEEAIEEAEKQAEKDDWDDEDEEEDDDDEGDGSASGEK